MADYLDELIREWEGLAVICRYDRATGSRIFIALHDARLGMPVGGTRMKDYSTPNEALLDAMHLAEGMTYKWGVAEFPFGGGKAVIDLPAPLEGEERLSFFRRYGRFLTTLNGTFATGVDLGTRPADMDVAAHESRFVFGRLPGHTDTKDPGPYTALGVYSGIRAALGHCFREEEPEGRTILIQGLGDVGAPLARLLAKGGARLLLCDTNTSRAELLADELGGQVVPLDRVYETECEVFAPCAVGGILNSETIPPLRCRIVGGSANNQLARTEDAELLHQRGILYAPDYVINAGGAILLGLLHQEVSGDATIRQRVCRIGDTLRELFEEAHMRVESPLNAARRLVERRLAQGQVSLE